MHNEMRARGVLLQCAEDKKRLDEELAKVKEVESVAKQYMLTLYGPCQECQNGHWPHCNSD